VLDKPGSVVLWTNCHHPFYDRNPYPHTAPEKRPVWVGDFWDMFGAGHLLELKNLKAIAVRGTLGVGNLVDPKAFMKVTAEKKKILAENALTGQGLPAYGTQVLMNIINEVGALPTRNHRDVQFEGAKDISAEAMAVLMDMSGDPIERLRRGIAVAVSGSPSQPSSASTGLASRESVHAAIFRRADGCDSNQKSGSNSWSSAGE